MRRVFAALLKAIRAVRLYTPNNEQRRQALSTAAEMLSFFVADGKSLPLDITEEGIQFRGERILQGDADAGLALILHKDGLRQLTFNPGVSIQEVEKLTALIANQLGNALDADDLIENLWEADFDHINYVAVDGFTELLENTAEGARPETGVANQFKRVITGILGVPTDVGFIREPSKAIPPFTRRDVSRQDWERIESVAIREEVAPTIRSFIQTPDAPLGDDRLWLRNAESESFEDLLGTVEDLLIELLETEPQEIQQDELAGLYCQLVQQWFLAGRLGAGLEAMTRLQQVGFGPSGYQTTIEVMQGVGTAETLLGVCGEHNQNPASAETIDRAAEFLRRCPLSAETLEKVMLEELSVSGARLMAALFVPHLCEAPLNWCPGLRQWPANTVEHILLHLSQMNPADVPLAAFREAFGHPSPKVRVCAVRNFPGSYDPVLRGELLALLKDYDDEVRASCYEWFGRSNDVSTAVYIASALRRSLDEPVPSAEIEHAASALLTLGQDRYLPFIQGHLALTAEHGDAEHDAVAALLKALAAAEGPAARDVIREFRKRATGRIRETTDRIWRSVVSQFTAEHTGVGTAVRSGPGRRSAPLIHAAPPPDARRTSTKPDSPDIDEMLKAFLNEVD